MSPGFHCEALEARRSKTLGTWMDSPCRRIPLAWCNRHNISVLQQWHYYVFLNMNRWSGKGIWRKKFGFSYPTESARNACTTYSGGRRWRYSGHFDTGSHRPSAYWYIVVCLRLCCEVSKINFGEGLYPGSGLPSGPLQSRKRTRRGEPFVSQ